MYFRFRVHSDTVQISYIISSLFYQSAIDVRVHWDKLKSVNTKWPSVFSSILLSPHGMRRHVVYVGHAINEIDKIWQQVSRRPVVGTGRNLFCKLIEGPCRMSEPRLVKFCPGGPGAPKYWRCQIFVTFFSYTVWQSAMKFGTMRGTVRNRF